MNMPSNLEIVIFFDLAVNEIAVYRVRCDNRRVVSDIISRNSLSLFVIREFIILISSIVSR
ncbi:hypothetical protein SDC9_123807 [bioreactor metagenome]|uniref:Uncharacterized protein n=1 Tax=bioreactor metagenome TaxID=1076179 RepID=A0A645CIS8_9ZZZZ